MQPVVFHSSHPHCLRNPAMLYAAGLQHNSTTVHLVAFLQQPRCDALVVLADGGLLHPVTVRRQHVAKGRAILVTCPASEQVSQGLCELI